MKVLFVVLYFGEFLKGGVWNGDLEDCTAKVAQSMGMIQQSYVPLGFQGGGISVICIPDSDLVIKRSKGA